MAKWSEYFVNRGHEVHLISVGDTPLSEEMPGVFIHSFPQFKSRLLRLAFTFILGGFFTRRVVNRLKPDILHAIEVSEGFCGALSGFHPFVMTPNGSDLLVYAKKYTIVRLIFKYIFQKADVITSDSVPLREASIALGAIKDRNYIIQWGVDLTQFNPQVDRLKIRGIYNVGDSLLILSPRAFTSNYNIDTIIHCIPEVLRERPTAKFMFIYGFGDKETEMRKLVYDLGIRDSVIFVGHVDYEEMPFYCAAADICISVPTSDSSPRSVYEAMACGVSPIISDLYWTKEFIVPEQNALIVPVRNSQALGTAIIRLLTDKRLREKMIKANLKLVDEKLNYHKHMAQMESVYQLACQTNPENLPNNLDIKTEKNERRR
jgi:glycosyltransferase involved in cell wall biosynthesis